MLEKYDKRQPIICSNCGKEMVFGKEVLKSDRQGSIFLRYICPHRKDESGCGAVKMVSFARESRQKLRQTKTRGGSFVGA